MAAIPSGLVVEQPTIAAFQKVEPRTAAALVYNSTDRDVPTWYLVTHAVMAQTTQLRLEQSPNLRAAHEECATARMRQEQKSFGPLSNPEASKIFLFGGVLRVLGPRSNGSPSCKSPVAFVVLAGICVPFYTLVSHSFGILGVAWRL